jgi:hypothetical protein
MIMRRTDRAFRCLMAVLTASAALVISFSRVAAQTPDAPGTARIEGRVIDTTDARIDNAIVEVLGVSGMATDANGVYRFNSLPAGAYIFRVRRLGYNQQMKTVLLSAGEVLRLDIELIPAVPQLEGVTTTAKGTGRPAIDDPTGFEWRRRMGNGMRFITEEEIAHRAPIQLSDMGIHTGSVGTSAGYPIPPKPRVKGTASNQCLAKQVFLNGTHVEDQFDLNSVPPSSIKGIEIYRGATDTPPMFQSFGTTCGTILVWTK